MQIRQAEYRPHTYIVENDHHCQLGTVDEFHTERPDTNTIVVSYVAIRFAGPIVGMPMPFEQKEFSGFTAALEFVGKR